MSTAATLNIAGLPPCPCTESGMRLMYVRARSFTDIRNSMASDVVI
jgi:hypothetical protein